ncbi:threonine synthase [Bartonella tamiae]|uniref:Threonine synthase n=1 Tax=Bartonella tamiae Th239 TaxID=1094558 RepID=J0QWX2_9HYPH|nr:threonine synthase [Bartonella tamiae]EJF90531.1 threonine synthase [Bartonella tamiae Th239]EJF93525.1 threonine synthase [Bartonella tamiae Th307]
MKYISTRGDAPILGFSDTVMTGLARDGGLYVPEKFPQFSPGAIRALRGKSYVHIAKTILWPFIEGDIDRHEFENMIDEAYATFKHPAICPLIQTGSNEFVLELFHGPTLAFKDVAMQLLGRLMDHILEQKNERATIIAATSGDTGGAAIEAFAGRQRSDIFILFPKGKVSPVQQRQMTSNHHTNVHALAIEGNFDDCQALVKTMFNDHKFRDSMKLSGVNSINWARIMAQIIYYFTSAISLGAPDRAVSFTVPTGNFGDIFAGFVASRMGLPVARLVIATNDNDILARTLATNIYETRKIIHTTSPSMDIQISSNFERLLFECSDRDSLWIRNAMDNLKQSGQFVIDEKLMTKIRTLFAAGSCNQSETAQMIDTIYKQSGYLVDPHTAIALKVGREHIDTNIPMITLSTAHPAKFPETVKYASGITPHLPNWLDGLMQREERYQILANDEKIVKNYIALKSCAST